MSLTDKEIALELVKSYVEHLNARVNQKASHSHVDAKYLASAYSYFYKTISSLEETENE